VARCAWFENGRGDSQCPEEAGNRFWCPEHRRRLVRVADRDACYASTVGPGSAPPANDLTGNLARELGVSREEAELLMAEAREKALAARQRRPRVLGGRAIRIRDDDGEPGGSQN
jgi:hypothetical protein